MALARQILILYILVVHLLLHKIRGETKKQKMDTKNKKDILVIGTWNKGGKWNSKLNTKIPEIENLLYNQKLDILAIQEANWTADMNEQTVHIKGYDIIGDLGRGNKKRKNSRTVIYIRDDIHYEILKNKMRTEYPEIWIRISEPGKRKTDLVTFYREYKQWNNKEKESKKDQDERYKKWCQGTADKMLTRGDTIIIGDFNGDWYRKNEKNYANKGIIDITEEELGARGMKQMVKEHTRVAINNDRPSMIDWVLTNAEHRINKTSLTFTSSDHKLVRTEWKAKIDIEPEYSEGRTWKNVDKQEIKRMAREIEWGNNWDAGVLEDTIMTNERIKEQIRNGERDDKITRDEEKDKRIGKLLDKNIRQMTKRMENILNTCGAKIEIKEKRRGEPRHSTKALREMTKQDKINRRKMQEEGKECTEQHIRETKNHHKKLRKKLKQAKLEACRKQIKEKTNDARNLFEGIKNYMNIGGDGAPKQFKNEKGIIKNKEAMSEAQHDYYDNKLKTVEKKVGRPNGNYLRILENRTMTRESIMRSQQITPEDIRREIARVKDKPSYGTDKMSYTVLKTFVEQIKRPLAEIGTVSLIQGVYPNIWKTSIVKPLYKGGQKSKTEPASYRPVSLLSAAGRIIEGIIAERMSNFAEDRKILPAEMHGYRKGLGSTTALIELQGDLLRKNSDGKITGMSLLDVSAGFDTVPHAYLLRKLEALGYSQRTLKWFISYLEDRWAMVQIGGSRSKRRRIMKGIPQGGPMSPALWREYTIDLTGSLTEETTKWRREVWRERKDYKEETWTNIDKRNSIVTARGIKKWQENTIDEEELHDMKKHAGREIKIRTGNTDTEPIIGKLEPEKGYTLYVDDCSTRASGDDVNIVKKRQKDATLAIFRSMRESRLCINADKTQIMLIMSNQRRKGMKNTLKKGEYSLELEGHNQKEIEHGEILGVTISNDLTWTKNWEKTKGKIRKKLATLIPLQKILGQKKRKQVIESACISLLTYCIEVTSGGGKKLIKDMDNTLSKLGRYVKNQKRQDYRKRATYEELKWLSAQQLIYWQSMKTLIKMKRDKKPENVVKHLFTDTGEVKLLTKQQLENMPKTRRQGWEIRVRRWWEEIDNEFKTNDVDMRKNFWSRKLKEYARTKYPGDGEKILYGDV